MHNKLAQTLKICDVILVLFEFCMSIDRRVDLHRKESVVDTFKNKKVRNRNKENRVNSCLFWVIHPNKSHRGKLFERGSASQRVTEICEFDLKFLGPSKCVWRFQ